MNKHGVLAHFHQRFEAILNDLDEMEMDGELEETNAQFEDILFWIENIDEDNADAKEEIEDAFEDLEDLIAEYRALAAERAELVQKVIELETIFQTASCNLL